MDTGRPPIRTVVVDDSETAVRAICSLLKLDPEIEVVGPAQDGAEALALAQKLRPELLLLDLEMPRMGGIETTREMKQELPDVRVIIITVHDTPEVRELCREAGAHGFVPKTRLVQEFPDVLHQLFRPAA